MGRLGVLYALTEAELQKLLDSSNRKKGWKKFGRYIKTPMTYMGLPKLQRR